MSFNMTMGNSRTDRIKLLQMEKIRNQNLRKTGIHHNKETPKPNGAPPAQLSKESINQIVSGLQEASANGLTNLPSRDIPMTNNAHITQDQQQKPNFVPEPDPEKRSRILEFSTLTFINFECSKRLNIDSLVISLSGLVNLSKG